MTSSTPTTAAAVPTTTTTATTPIPPSIMWAQRTGVLYVTIVAECKDVNTSYTKDSMTFRGAGVSDNKLYEVTLNFLKEIVPDKVTQKDTARCIQYTIPKAEYGPFWTNLTTDKKKPHFLKVDFNKWVDEESGNVDNSPDEGNPDLMNMFDFGGGDKSKFGGADKPSFDDIYDQSDSDDEELPNLE